MRLDEAAAAKWGVHLASLDSPSFVFSAFFREWRLDARECA
jgi:hypothetical protein